jgi:GNAT superfamily N-acetyltransferase
MNIRKFEIKDEDQVITLWKECNLVVPWNDPKKDIQRKLNVNPELFLVGEMDGNIVATIMGGYERHRGWVNYLAVSPTHQRKGYGRQMMHARQNADHTVFLSGNDIKAKMQVTELLHEFGWNDILDLGDISTARSTEMMLSIGHAVMRALSPAEIAFKVVR